MRNIQHCTKLCLQYLLFHKITVMTTPINMANTTATNTTTIIVTSVSLYMKRFINQQLQKLYKGLLII